MTISRRDFFRNHSQVLLIDKVIPYHALHFRDLSPGSARLDVRATLTIEEDRDREATWIEEAIFYSLGSGQALQWLDRWLINPIFQLLGSYRTNKVFRRLQGLMETKSPLAPDQKGQSGA